MDRFVEKVQYSFLDYISSGFELNFMVAVDFTGDASFYSLYVYFIIQKKLGF